MCPLSTRGVVRPGAWKMRAHGVVAVSRHATGAGRAVECRRRCRQRCRHCRRRRRRLTTASGVPSAVRPGPARRALASLLDSDEGRLCPALFVLVDVSRGCQLGRSPGSLSVACVSLSGHGRTGTARSRYLLGSAGRAEVGVRPVWAPGGACMPGGFRRNQPVHSPQGVQPLVRAAAQPRHGRLRRSDGDRADRAAAPCSFRWGTGRDARMGIRQSVDRLRCDPCRGRRTAGGARGGAGCTIASCAAGGSFLGGPSSPCHRLGRTGRRAALGGDRSGSGD